MPACPQRIECSPTVTLCPTWTRLSIFVPRPMTVSPSVARSTVALAPISTSSSSRAMPTCGTLRCPCAVPDVSEPVRPDDGAGLQDAPVADPAAEPGSPRPARSRSPRRPRPPRRRTRPRARGSARRSARPSRPWRRRRPTRPAPSRAVRWTKEPRAAPARSPLVGVQALEPHGRARAAATPRPRRACPRRAARRARGAPRRGWPSPRARAARRRPRTGRRGPPYRASRRRSGAAPSSPWTRPPTAAATSPSVNPFPGAAGRRGLPGP